MCSLTRAVLRSSTLCISRVISEVTLDILLRVPICQLLLSSRFYLRRSAPGTHSVYQHSTKGILIESFGESFALMKDVDGSEISIQAYHNRLNRVGMPRGETDPYTKSEVLLYLCGRAHDVRWKLGVSRDVYGCSDSRTHRLSPVDRWSSCSASYRIWSVM